jgi:hypothetical protein
VCESHQYILTESFISVPDFMNLNRFSEMLNKFQSISSLYISDCKIITYQNNCFVHLRSLKNLIVRNSDWQFLKMFENCLEIEYVRLNGKVQSNRDTYLVEFLMSHPAIKTMVLGGSGKDFLKKPRVYPFRLTKMSIDGYESSLVNFLQQQKYTLRELELKISPNFEVMRCAIADLQLEKLQIGAEEFSYQYPFMFIPIQQNRREQNARNSHLKTLVLHGNVHRREILEEIFSKFTSIEKLQIINCKIGIERIIEPILTKLKNLKHLLLPKLSGTFTPISDLQSLKSLHVSNVENSNQLVNLSFVVKFCSNLEVLTIGHADKDVIKNSTLEFLLKNLNLKELCLGINFEFNDQAFNIIQINGKKLQQDHRLQHVV